MNLFIVWNSFSILEFLSVEKNYKDYYVYIDKDYNKRNINDIKNVVDKFIDNNIFLGYVDDLYENEYDNLFIMSYLNDYYLNILQNVKYSKLNLLEEGFSDYLKFGATPIESKYYKNANLYVNNINEINNVFSYNSVYQINFEDDILKLFFGILNFDYNCINNIDVVVFTSPMNDDYNYFSYTEKVINYLNTNYKDKNILIKKHPRDNNTYEGDYNLFEVDKMVPGQFVDLIYNCKRLFVHPSTVILSSKNLSDIDILKFTDLDNDNYNNVFNYKIIKQCNIIEIN